MKKILILALLCLGITCSLSAQEVVGSYFNAYFNVEYNIKASLDEKREGAIYIEVSAKDQKTALINVEAKDLEKFKSSLLQMKNKYVEWSDTAKKNDIKELNKEMAITFPKVTICWATSKWYFAFEEDLVPQFIILNDGSHVVTMVNKVSASSNEYIQETTYWAFSTTEDIDNLLKQLDLDAIEAKLLESKKTEDLFQ